MRAKDATLWTINLLYYRGVRLVVGYVQDHQNSPIAEYNFDRKYKFFVVEK